MNSRQHFYISSPELRYSLLEFNSRNNCQHLTNWTRWNKRDKVWSSATSLLKWPFRSRRRRCCWSSLMSQFQSLFSVDLFVYTHNSGKSICSLVLYISAWKTLFEANRPSFRVLSGYKMPKLPKTAFTVFYRKENFVLCGCVWVLTFAKSSRTVTRGRKKIILAKNGRHNLNRRWRLTRS